MLAIKCKGRNGRSVLYKFRSKKVGTKKSLKKALRRNKSINSPKLIERDCMLNKSIGCTAYLFTRTINYAQHK